jgi:hypothetical protein
MTTIFSGDTGASAVGDNTVGNNQVIAGSLPLSKLSVTLPFTKEYVSAEQTITAAGLLTLAHGFGSAPKVYSFSLICKTAENGYSIGDVVVVTTTHDLTDTTALNRGVSVVGDSTNIRVRFVNSVNCFSGINFSTGAPVVQTNANWRLIVRAWA